MTRPGILASLLGCSLLLGVPLPPATAVEPWADGRLKVTEGMMLWLDAGRLPEAWKAHGKPTLVGEAPFDVWYDASGQGLHLVQRVRDAQPRFISAGGHAVVRFDGENDCLGLTRQNRSLSDFTVFLVAAPRSNAGGFRGFLSANETGKNDYVTGFTLDQHGFGSARFELLNVEGKGFGGAVSLMKSAVAFGEFHSLTVVCQVGRRGVKLFLDGQPAGERDRAPGRLRVDDLTLGARFYSNTPAPPFLSGFLDGDIAEVLLYDRALGPAERQAVEEYLAGKHRDLTQAIASADRRGGHRVRSVANPPPVQMLLPGFSVRQLPVDLSNINNLRYRADGKLVALAYDGNIYLLSDSDGDGLEDKVERFWDNQGRLQSPIGMALTPPGYRHGNGVFVACKGKLSLIVDTDGDDKADREIVVATGWKALDHGVDALGVALDRDGSVYFGLGTASFTNGYLVDKDGKAHYDLKSERGTILRVAPDFSSREVVCTGIRFPVGLAFNPVGDLFATDQEGATWLPNGNPFDELLHIRPGRHYGFPPRHPKHLPTVIDEPSVFDYAPQHQSTCGLHFNVPVNGGPTFGPREWAGDALVSGYSRGKLFRTKLVMTAHGYVAHNHLLACLNQLAVDACVSPKGELVVATHSGAPDWGSGPTGKGKLFKITFSDPGQPQPVLTWAAGPSEVRIAFDRPLDPRHLQDLSRQVAIEYGQYVYPGDRFESLRPGYEAVHQQLLAPRYDLPVRSVQVSGDRRTLIVNTAPHPAAVHYAVTLPGLGCADAPGSLPQQTTIELGYDLCGVAASWKADDGQSSWSGWLPHVDLAVGRALTVGSVEHDHLWRLLRQPGKLTLRTKLDLWNMLRPSVQAGSRLDHTPAAEEVLLIPRPDGLLEFNKKPVGKVGVWDVKTGRREDTTQRVLPRESEPFEVELVLATGAASPAFDLAYTTAEDQRLRPLALHRFLLPWASTKPRPAEATARREIPELGDGDWARGRRVFFSDEAMCSRCHSLHGQGGRIGPDLSNLVHRDYDSVLRDIRDPNASLHPDHIPYVVELKDGRVLTGVVRADGLEHLLVGNERGEEARVRKQNVEATTPSPISVMPQGVDKVLGPAKLRDLLTFLLTEPLQPAPLEREGAPPPRRRAEVEAVRKADQPTDGRRKKMHIVLVAGPKDHGPGEHDYPLWQRRWVNLMSLADDVTVSTADGWPSGRQWQTADVIVFYSANPAWSGERTTEMDAYLKRGGGLVYLHYAVDGRSAVEALSERIGLAWRGGLSRFRHGALELAFPDPQHPITRGFGKMRFEDESYWQLVGDPKRIHVLATGSEDGQPQPLLWTHERGKGRVFVSILGHYTWTFDDPLFRILILRGMAWSAGEPTGRWTDLATVGARLGD